MDDLNHNSTPTTTKMEVKPKTPIRVVTPLEFQFESEMATKLALSKLKNEIEKTPNLIDKTFHFQNMARRKKQKEQNYAVYFLIILILGLVLIHLDIFNYFTNEIHYLVKNKSEKVIQMIETGKLDVNHPINNKMDSLLFLGVQNGDVEFVKKLISLKANLEYRNSDFNNILHQVRSMNMAEYLLKDNSKLLNYLNNKLQNPLVHLIKIFKNEDELLKVIMFYISRISTIHLKVNELELLKSSLKVYSKFKNPNILIELFKRGLDGNIILFFIQDVELFDIISPYININTKDSQGRNLLYYVESMKMLKMLMKLKIRFNEIDSFHLSPISFQLFKYCSKKEKSKEMTQILKLMNENIKLNTFDISLIQSFIPIKKETNITPIIEYIEKFNHCPLKI
jgi:ankyrin repeat protein